VSFTPKTGGPPLGRPPGVPRSWTLNDFLFPGDAGFKNAPPLSQSEYEQQLIKAAQRIKNGDGFPINAEIRLQVQRVVPYVIANPAASATTPWGVPSNNKPIPKPPGFEPPKPGATTATAGSTSAAKSHAAGRPIFAPTTLPNPATPTAVRHQHIVAGKQVRYSASDTSVISFDLEITSLNSRMVFNPSEVAWQTDLDKLVAITNNTKNVRARAKAAKELEFFKYYEPLGLAQVHVQGGEFDRHSLTEIARGKEWKGINPNGYVVWTDDLSQSSADLMGKLGSWDQQGTEYIGSIFANRQGITSRSLEALAQHGPGGTPVALSQSEAVVAFFKGVKTELDAGKKVVFRNQNAWFDVLGMSSLAVRHQEAMFAAGLDPLMLVDAYRQGKMSVHSTEEAFFGLLRTRAVNDPEWAAKYIKYGKMGASIFPGASPGKPIDMAEELARFLKGEPTHLRARAGWSLETLTTTFGQYIDFSKVGAEEFGGRTWEQLSAMPLHDATKDTAVSEALYGRMERAIGFQKELAAMDVAGHLDSRTLQAIAAARAGLLGEEFNASGAAALDLGQYVGDLSRAGKVELAVTRHENLWSTWTGLTAGSLAASEKIAAGRIRTPFEYLTLGQRAQRSFGGALNASLDALTHISSKPHALVGVAVAGMVLTAGAMALFRKGQRIQANLPPVYLPGQQAKQKAVRVPWSSPYHGSDQDVGRASRNFHFQGRRYDDEDNTTEPSRAEANLLMDLIEGITCRVGRLGVPFGSPWHGLAADLRRAKTKSALYVDVDGTLLGSALDDEFSRRVAREGQGAALAWYRSGTRHVNDLPVNEPLAAVLRKYRDRGHEIVLWTQRGEGQRAQTLENLGEHASLFSRLVFADGRKRDALGAGGVIIDNEARNAAKGFGFVHVPTFRGQAAEGFAPWLEQRLIREGAFLRRPAVHLTANAIEGMGGRFAGIVSKVLRSAFGSPWHGVHDDVEKAKYETDQKVKAAAKLGLGFGAWWASQNVWGLIGQWEWGRKLTEKAYFASRWIEDAFPLRIGRIFGHSSHISSFLAPTSLDVRISHLLHSGQLTTLGEAYARGMGLDAAEFEKYLLGHGGDFLRFERHGVLPYHEIDLGELGTHHVRMFQAGSYQGKVYAGYGASDVRLRPGRPIWHADQRAMHWAESDAIPKPIRKIFQWLWGKEGFRNRWRRIENQAFYDNDLVNRMYVGQQVGEQLWVPGYEAPLNSIGHMFGEAEGAAGTGARALRRYASSSLYTWTRSAWNLLRHTVGNVTGHDIGPASNYRKIVKGTAKAGAKLYGGIVAFNFLNDTFGGKLTSPLWNARDRLMIGHAWVSDKLGLTRIKKRQKRQGTFSSLAWGLLPATGLLTFTYLYRVTKLGRDLNRAKAYYEGTRHVAGRTLRPGGGRLDFRPGGRMETMLAADGKRIVRRWIPYSRRLMSEVGTPRITKGLSARTNIVAARLVKYLTKKTASGRRLTGVGWMLVGAWAAATALFLPFLGSSETVRERKDRIAGKRKVAVRSGQFFEFGARRYEGGRVKYWRLDASARHRLRADQRIAGNRGGLIGAIKTLFNPYWREKEAYRDRPYPITGTPFQDVPFVGALLGRTIGRFFKPPKLMHSAEWKPGDPYQEFNDWVEPNQEMGGLSPDKPANPLGWRAQVRAGVYNYTKLMGFTGAVLQHHVVNTIWGTGEAPYGYVPELAQPRFGSFTDRYWEAAFGGGGAKGDLFRRFFPRRQTGIQVDPLKNAMPSWLPSSEYVVDLQHGDPYCLTGSTYVESGLQFISADSVKIGSLLVDAKGNQTVVTALSVRAAEPTVKVTLALSSAFPTTASPDHPFLVRLVKGRGRRPRTKLYVYANLLLDEIVRGSTRIEAMKHTGLRGTVACAAWKLLERCHKIKIRRKGRQGTVEVLDAEPFDGELLERGLVFVQAQELSQGDYVAYPRPSLDESTDTIDMATIGSWSAVTNKYVYYRASQGHAENLEYLLGERDAPGDRSSLYQARSSLKSGYRPQRFPRHVCLTPELGRYIGLWLAEGWCNKDGTTATAHHIKEAEEVSRIYSAIGLSGCWRPVDGTNGAIMTIGSRGLAALVEHLCGKGARSKRLSDIIFHAPKDFIRALLDGYFFGDGCEFTSNGRHRNSAITSSPILALQIRKLLLAMGIAAGIVHRPAVTPNSSKPNQVASGDCWQINVNNQSGPTTWFADDRYFYFRVNAVELSDSEATYGFMTSSSTFCAVGAATHNTKIPEGEYRLPGKGFERVHPELKGVDPEKYPAWAKHEILADVAPYSKQYYQARDEAALAAQKDAGLAAKYEAVEKEAEEQRRRGEFDKRSFTEKTDRVRGEVSEVLPDGRFRLAQYPNHVFRMAGANFGIDSVSDQLREENHWTKEKAVRVAGEQEAEREKWLRDRLLGESVAVDVHHGGLGRPEVEGELFVGGTSFARRAVEEGYAGTDGEGRYQAGLLGRLYGAAVERVSHIPQKVPGPWFLHSKLNNVADPIEAYRRDQLYGTEERNWNKPWKDFLRPYLFQGIAKLTPGDYVPPHVQKERDVDVLYDRLAYLKAYKAGDQVGMAHTMAGVNVEAPTGQVAAALPYRDRPYFDAFAEETDPSKRRTIMGMVSPDMQKALVGQWTRDYNETVGVQAPMMPTTGNPVAAAAQAAADIKKAGYEVPGPGWVGWQQGADLTDVQAIQIRSEGMESHDFNIWDDRLASLSRKPYLNGAYEHLCSRPLRDAIPILSSNDSTGLAIASQHISPTRSANADVQFQVDRSSDERNRQHRAMGSMIG
jgi:hypothetical protein